MAEASSAQTDTQWVRDSWCSFQWKNLLS